MVILKILSIEFVSLANIHALAVIERLTIVLVAHWVFYLKMKEYAQ
jgi:hypothetical protein